MANLKNFLNENTKELIIGSAVGLLITLLGGFQLEEGATLIVLGMLLSLILNQSLKSVSLIKENQKTIIIVLLLVGGFFLMRQFQLGIFSMANFNAVQGQFVSGAALAGIGSIVGGLAKAPLLGLFILVAAIPIGLLLFGFPIAGLIALVALLLVFGIPIIGVSISIMQNFQLIIIMGALILLAFMIFRTKQIKAVTRT